MTDGVSHAYTREGVEVGRLGGHRLVSVGGCLRWMGALGWRGRDGRMGRGRQPVRATLWGRALGVAARRGVRVDAACGDGRCVAVSHAVVRHPGRLLKRLWPEDWREQRVLARRAGELLWRRCGEGRGEYGQLTREALDAVVGELGVGRLTALCGWALVVRDEADWRKYADAKRCENEG